MMNGEQHDQYQHNNDNHEHVKHEQHQQGGQQHQPPPQNPDGYFLRLNGGMLQTGKYMEHIVSLVGQIISHDTIRTADGSNVKVLTEHLTANDDDDGTGGGGGLLVDPNVCVEIMGQVSGPTEITAFVCRPLAEMDLGLYNQMIGMQQQSKYLQYFTSAS
mmetsp:Transcript_10077/g.11555  ORF Transcript_10077/g.11555 Transcript_10077/m.11555 type:complete len:160 (-) Transcript_10077:86-565(-)